MARTRIDPETQLRAVDAYDDTVAPSLANYETNPVSVQDNLNSIHSMLSDLLDGQAGNWYDGLNTPAAIDAGTQRGINDLNTALHSVETQRRLRHTWNLKSVAVTAAANVQILGAAGLPANLTAAVGAVTTKGTVVAAHTGAFGAHALDLVAGSSAISPKNLLLIVDAASRDPILDGGDRVYGLLQGESGLTDGATITGATTTRVQISFVKIAANALVAVAGAAIGGKSIDYAHVARISRSDMTEQDFLSGADVDVIAGATITRQASYDAQGTAPVELTTNATLDLNSAGISWAIRDLLNASLLSVVEGTGGSNSTLRVEADVDVFDVNALVNDFVAGATLGSGLAAPVEVGVSSGLVRTVAGNLEMQSAGDLILDDANFAAEATWVSNGIKVSDTAAEVAAYEAAVGGELSLLAGITAAMQSGSRGVKTYANVTNNGAANIDIGGAIGGANLDAQLPDMSAGNFLQDYDLFWNGALQRPGANAAANNDYYPGTSLALGQVRLEFKSKSGDVVAVIPWV